MTIEEPLTKFILGILVVVAVATALFFFFKFGAIDFFKNIIGGEEEEIKGEITPETKSILETCREKIEKGEYKSQEECLKEEKPSRLCEDCKKNFRDPCPQEECFEISDELRKFGKKCHFEEKLTANQCITEDI